MPLSLEADGYALLQPLTHATATADWRLGDHAMTRMRGSDTSAPGQAATAARR